MKYLVGPVSAICAVVLGYYSAAGLAFERVAIPPADAAPETIETPPGARPVYETRTKVIKYNVSRPVWETKTKVIDYTVMKPVWEERAVYPLDEQGRPKTERAPIRTYRVCRMVREHRSKEIEYKVCRMETEPREKEVSYRAVRFEPTR